MIFAPSSGFSLAPKVAGIADGGGMGTLKTVIEVLAATAAARPEQPALRHKRIGGYSLAANVQSS